MSPALRGLALAVLLVAVGAGSFFGARAAVRRAAPEAFSGDPAADLVRALDLTPDQEREVRSLHAAMVSRNRVSAVRIEENCAEFCDILRGNDPDPARVEAYIQKTDAAQDAVQREVISYLLEVRKLLTDEQAGKLADMVGDSVRWNCAHGPCCGAAAKTQPPCAGGRPPVAPPAGRPETN